MSEGKDGGTARDVGRKRILVINDTKEILELFRDLLENEMGHDVTLMSYAPDELAQVVEAQPDLVILDFVIGDREAVGWQLLQKLRMHPATARIPVVACTAAVQLVRESQGYLLQQGVEVVLKPFTLEQLEHAVHGALRLDGSTVLTKQPATDGQRDRSAQPSS
jgi:CheY-like chemotaxis protein